MSEENTAPPAETGETAPEATAAVDAKPAEDPRVTKANREAAEYRKQLRTTQADLEKLQKAQMTEAERLATEAEARGRSTALAEVGQRLVRAEFRALAGGRVTDLDELLDDLNLGKFLGEDGEPDSKAIGRAVARLIPEPAADTSRQPGPRPDLSQGGSNKHMALNSDGLTEALKAAVGA